MRVGPVHTLLLYQTIAGLAHTIKGLFYFILGFIRMRDFNQECLELRFKGFRFRE